MFDCIIGVKVKSFEKYRKKLELLDKWKPKSEKRTWKLTEMEAIVNIFKNLENNTLSNLITQKSMISC